VQLATYLVLRQNRDRNGAAGPVLKGHDGSIACTAQSRRRYRHLQGCISHEDVRTSFARHRCKRVMPWTACELARGRVYRRRSALSELRCRRSSENVRQATGVAQRAA
jgi:hypothetical protein